MYAHLHLPLWRAIMAAAVVQRSISSGARAQQDVRPAHSAMSGSAEVAREWFPTPSILPAGGKIAVVSGNPFEPGPFTLEFQMPDGYTLPPHTNPSNEHVTVTSGALMVGLGRNIDRRESVVLITGDTASVPAGVPHWSIAKGDTRLIVSEEMGPYGIAYMSVRDEPGSHSFPSGYGP